MLHGRAPRVGVQLAQHVRRVGHRKQHDVGLRGAHRPAAAPAGRRRAERAFKWSSASRSMRSSADQPAAASTPPCRTPPPSILRSRRASAMNSVDPATTDPTGAPSPLLKQTWTVSTPTVSAPGGTPSATAACQSRAPSRCTRRPAALRGRHGPGMLLGRGDRATRGVVGVLQAQQRGAQRVVGPRRAGCSAHRVRRDPARPGVVRHRTRACRRPARRRCRARRRARARPPARGTRRPGQVAHQRDQVAHGPAGHPQRGRPCPAARRPVPPARAWWGRRPRTSSPTSAAAIAVAHRCVGRVTVSERRSMEPSWCHRRVTTAAHRGIQHASGPPDSPGSGSVTRTTTLLSGDVVGPAVQP